MGTSGTLNVVCHGAIAFVMQDDGSITLWMPDVDQSWNHEWQAGTWARKGLHSLQGGWDYQLTGVREGDGRQRFNAVLDLICTTDRPPVPRGLRNLRTLHLPKPRSIHASNTIPFRAADSFQKLQDVPGTVKAMKQLALLHVISYDCDNLESVRVLAANGSVSGWRPRVLSAVKPAAVNLHVFAEPRTFGPRIVGKPVRGRAPFNVLVGALKCASPFLMKIGKNDSVSFADIAPGQPVPGLPENQKLSLSQLAHFQESGVLNQFSRPYNCGPLVTQPSTFAMAAAPAPKAAAPARAFAILQNKKPKVLARPQIALVHWGLAAPDPLVESTVRKMIGLPFVTGALSEYGVSAPQWAGSFVNPRAGEGKIEDGRGVPAKAGRGIARTLRSLISAEKLPDPRKNRNLLYLIVPGSKTSGAIPGVLGAHNFFYLEPEHIPVRYAWALWGWNGAASLQTLTRTLSHELLEACTDPEPPSGYVFEGAEICDIAMGLATTVDGIELAGYFSYKDGVCKP